MGKRKITNIEVGNAKPAPAHRQVGWKMDETGRAAKQPPANVGNANPIPSVPAKTRVAVKDAKEKAPAAARELLHRSTHGQSRKGPADVHPVVHNHE